MEPKFTTLCKLPKARSETNQIISAYDRGLFEMIFAAVKHTVIVKSEAVKTIWTIDQPLDIASDILAKFLEKVLRFLTRQRPHLRRQV